jgi:hypothetical protein
MKKKFLLLLIAGIILLTTGFILNTSFVKAETSNTGTPIKGKIFGGKIKNTKATALETKEKTYNCTTTGETFELTPLKGLKVPTGYMIENGTKNSTGYKIKSGQWIIGKYSGKSSITCTLKMTPFTESTVELDTITIYGTSKQ